MQFAYTEMLIFLVKLFRFSDFKVLNNDVDLEFLVTLRPKISCYLNYQKEHPHNIRLNWDLLLMNSFFRCYFHSKYEVEMLL